MSGHRKFSEIRAAAEAQRDPQENERLQAEARAQLDAELRSYEASADEANE